jgi:hypothetical protein
MNINNAALEQYNNYFSEEAEEDADGSGEE